MSLLFYVTLRQSFLNVMNEICNDVEITETLLLYRSDTLTLDENSKTLHLLKTI